MNTTAPLLRTCDLAAMLQVDVKTIRMMLARGELPEPIRINARVLRWRQEVIDQFLAREVPAIVADR